ncbi:MAG: hypothetical protein IPK71_29970 [Myxococcales bacterium]|jgi:hypothetical protein|nr:hypothetical protein [Myxococcales bacterium]
MKALRFFLVVGLVAGVGCALPPSREAASGGAHHPSSAQEIEASSAPETCDRTRTIELRRTLADAVEEARILTCAAGTVRVTVSRRERVEPTEPASDRGDDVAEGVTSVAVFRALYAQAATNAASLRCPALPSDLRAAPRDAIVLRAGGAGGRAVVCGLGPGGDLWAPWIAEAVRSTTLAHGDQAPTGEHVWQDEIRYGWRGPRR